MTTPKPDADGWRKSMNSDEDMVAAALGMLAYALDRVARTTGPADAAELAKLAHKRATMLMLEYTQSRPIF